MSLAPGTRLGPYRIDSALGAGGMGEVYRATDTRLDRVVAVKVLPQRVSAESRLQERFEREARALAGFSHPHICTLHDVGNQDGIRFLVMELLDGETLAERLERGALPLAEALGIGIQLADALDAAHRRGVVHRDVKPANVVLTPKGVKLLDFGLARDSSLFAPRPTSDDAETATRHEAITSEGALVGTLRYMAPEQVEGREADARTDLFALGIVLYEMIAGAPPFVATSQAGLIAAILKEEPSTLEERDPLSPPAVSRIVSRCLEKDPERRWQSARDLTLELEWASRPAQETTTAAPVRRRGSERAAWALSLVLALALVASLGLPRREALGAGVSRLSVDLPPGATSSFVRVSPDGRALVFSLFREGQGQLWTRPLDSVTSRPLPGTQGAAFPFWSPDGRHVGFFADGMLKKVDVNGGAVQVVCEAPGPFSMGSWSPTGTILFSLQEVPGREGLYRVSEEGGTPERLVVSDEAGREWLAASPSFLPDGEHFLVTCGRVEEGRETLGLCAGALDDGRLELLLESASQANAIRGEYAEPGYLLYTDGPTLLAQPFDASRRVVSGQRFVLADRVMQAGPIGFGNFSVAGDVLAYQIERSGSELVWHDRSGRPLGNVSAPDSCQSVELSPDGKQLAVSAIDEKQGVASIWIVDLDRDVSTRLTGDRGDDVGALWSPDGQSLVFSSARDAPPFLHEIRIADGAETVLLPSDGTLHAPNDWSPDGRTLLFSIRDAETGWDLWTLSRDDPQHPVPFLSTPASEFIGSISPDGSWVAYSSNESGRTEIYLARFPDGGEKRRVSRDGGFLPKWNKDGTELYYRSPDNGIVAVPVRIHGDVELGTPETLFTFTPAAIAFVSYDVTADGRRFITISAPPGESAAPIVVTGWSSLASR